ncbi:MAG TPA: ribose-phosphate diphosphokinase [Rhizomicrobium sp.]
MNPAFLFALPGNDALTRGLATQLHAKVGNLSMRKFPDRETYLRYDDKIAGKDIALVCTLDDPDSKLVPLILAASGARQLGAARVGLVAPYLAYMRQDARFQPGEAVTSRTIATLLSSNFDWLVTVDPHLHRHRSLSEIYAIPTQVVHAAPAIAAWIRANVGNPFLIGPDEESAQWIKDVAGDLHAPCATLRKHRQGDRAVSLEPIDLARIGDRTPVLVDDIIASGQTMIEAAKLIGTNTASAPICIAVHGLFFLRADQQLVDMGARVVTTNTVPGAAAEIVLDKPIADGIRAAQALR